MDLVGNPVCDTEEYKRDAIFEMIPSLEVSLVVAMVATCRTSEAPFSDKICIFSVSFVRCLTCRQRMVRTSSARTLKMMITVMKEARMSSTKKQTLRKSKHSSLPSSAPRLKLQATQLKSSWKDRGPSSLTITTTKRKVRLIKTERAQRKKMTMRAMKKKVAISVPVQMETETNETKPPYEYASVLTSPGYLLIKPGAN